MFNLTQDFQYDGPADFEPTPHTNNLPSLLTVVFVGLIFTNNAINSDISHLLKAVVYYVMGDNSSTISARRVHIPI